MGQLKAGEYGVKVYAKRITSATTLASTLANDNNAKLAITATATVAKTLTEGISQLTNILQRIQGDLGAVSNDLMSANKSLGDTNARLLNNQNALAQVPHDTYNILAPDAKEEAEAIKKTNAKNASTKAAINKKIAADKLNAAAYTTKITQLNAKKWSLSVLANRILQSINKVSITHDSLLPVRDKLVSYNETSGYGYLKFTALAQQSQSAFETLWNNLNRMDNESRFNIYNTSVMNILNGKAQDGSEIGNFAPLLGKLQADIEAAKAAKAAELKTAQENQDIAIKKHWADEVKKGQDEMERQNQASKDYVKYAGGVAAALVALPFAFGTAGVAAISLSSEAAVAGTGGAVIETSSGLLIADASVVGSGAITGSGTATTLAELGIGASTPAATGGLTIAGVGTTGAGVTTALTSSGTATTLAELGISGSVSTGAGVSTAAATTSGASTVVATASEVSAATSAYQTALSRLSAASDYLEAVKSTPGIAKAAIENAQALVNSLKPGLQTAFETLSKVSP